MCHSLRKLIPWFFSALVFIGLFFLMSSVMSSPHFRRNRLFSPGEHQIKMEQKTSSEGDRKTEGTNLAEQGLDILQNTFERLPQFVGAKINCTNCHLNKGTTPGAAPWIDVTHRFPQYRHRTGKEVTLTDRINDCFERSLNGHRLPDDHPAMKAMLSYMTSLSQGQKVKGRGIQKLKLDHPPNIKNGEKVYHAKCASCHQSHGQGLFTDNGQVVYPPLWGKDSFNIAAGMARLHTAAGFAKHNMPLGQGDSLTDDEAWDVGYYFSQQNRPDYANKDQDWPKGHKPEDARY